MNHASKNNILARIMPYLSLGIFIVLFIVGLIVFSYIILIGAIIGLVLFLIGYIRSKLSNHKPPPHFYKKPYHGRTIEHDNSE